MVAAAVVGAAVVGGVASSSAASSASNASHDAAASAAASSDRALEAQTAQADKLLEFNKQQYEDGKARQVGIDAINKQVIDQNLDLSAKAGKRADETYDFYKTNGRPVVQQALDDSKNYDSQGNIDAARGRATADVAQGFDNAEQQSQRALTRMGVNPSSGRFLALQQRMQADKAAALAGAGTNAEETRRAGAIGLRQQASNLAQGMPAQSLAQGQQSSTTATAASGTANLSAGQNSALSQQALNGMAAGAGIYGNAASGYNNLYGTSMNAYSNINSSAAASQAGWGNLAGTAFSMYGRSQQPSGVQDGGSSYNTDPSSYGAQNGSDVGFMMADGGKVKGPGTGTSDSVPAVNTSTGGKVMLSNGEYVLSADTVKALGTKYLDNLQRKHHTPVNLGRAAA